MPTTPHQKIVELKDLSKSYYLSGGLEVPVLHQVNLTVFDGDMLAILGPSGSGKSTLMNIIVISWNVVLFSALIALAIGIIFGVYPARRASKLQPVDALRSE